MNFLPDSSIMLSYTVATLILFATPGPDMSLFLAKTIAQGRAAGIAAMAGALAGCCVHTLAAALGLSAIIAASATAFATLKIVGALYLLWLAIDAIRNGSSLSVKAESGAPADLKKTFLLGLGVNLTNPKIVLFFITFLPQFVSASDPHAAAKLMFLGLYFVAVSIPLSILMILGAERLVGALKARPAIMRIIDYAFAGIFGAFAVHILTTQNR